MDGRERERDLRATWDAHAGDWTRWARSPLLDHLFWRMTLPALLALLPPPGRRTLDLGCGEGRVSRELRALGHDVVGVEGSPALAAAARETDPAIEVHVADAAALPLADFEADLVVACLVLMNVDDLDGVVGEAARVLRPGGALCAAVLHPLNTLGDAGPGTSYFATRRYAETVTGGGTAMTFHDVHRPLGAYAAALERAGLVLERFREPVPDDEHVAAHPAAARWRERPAMLLWRARRPAG